MHVMINGDDQGPGAAELAVERAGDDVVLRLGALAVRLPLGDWAALTGDLPVSAGVCSCTHSPEVRRRVGLAP